MSESPKKMLEVVLKYATLTPQENEMLGDIWDRIHRYKRATRMQGLLIEKFYYGQNLNKGARPRQEKEARERDARKPKNTSKIATLKYEGLESEKCVTTLDQFGQVCPNITPGSKQYAKIAQFFQKGGEVLRIQPS